MRKSKYPKELITEARRMRKEGYEYTAIAKYLGFSSKQVVMYHTNPKFRKKHNESVENWNKNNRQQKLTYMRDYDRKKKKKYRATPEDVIFLEQSNAIEGVDDVASLEQAIIAWEYLMQQDTLTTGVVLKTHKILMLNQRLSPNEKGYFRTCQVYVGKHEGVRWEKIPLEIESWLENVKTSIKIPGEDGNNIKLDHIEYERIHPFIDGNGRTGRMFLNWQRKKAGLPILVIHAGKEQMEYYKWFK